MRRWSALLLVVCVAWLGAACAGANAPQSNASSIADLVLRVGEDIGTEVETFPSQLPPGLDAALNPTTVTTGTTLPTPPRAVLQGSGRVARPDGSITFFVMYELSTVQESVAGAMHSLVNTGPWQVVGGQTSEGVAAYNFASTQTDTISGTVVVQPLPTTDHFDVVVARNGKNTTLTIRRHAFAPVLGADLQEQNGGLVVSRIVPGDAATSGLQQGDRIVRIGGKDVKDTASMQTALRSLDGKAVRTSVIYIVRAAPDVPVQAAFAPPQARPLPDGFPTPYLVFNGETPITTQWTASAAGGMYQLTLVTHDTPTNVANAYRQVLGQQKAQITSDTPQGTSTTIEFTSADQATSGSLTVDVFPQDNAYTAVSLQVSVGSAGAPGAAPGAPPVPQPSGTPAPQPSGTPGTQSSGTPAAGATP